MPAESISVRPGPVARWYPRMYEWYFTRTPLGRKLREKENAALFRVLDDLVIGGEHLLDVGCGTGQYALALAARAGRVVGIDPRRAMVDHLEARARKEGIANIEVRPGAAPDDVPAEPEFDGVLMIGVMNYNDGLDAILASVARAMKPGAWFLFTVVPPSLEGKLHRATDRMLGSRVYLYGVDEVTRASEQAGLEVRHLGTEGLTKGGIDSIFVARRPYEIVR